GLQPGPWILGERFSAADVMLASAVRFMRLFKLIGDDETVLKDYAERCLARPAAQRALAAEARGSIAAATAVSAIASEADRTAVAEPTAAEVDADVAPLA